MCSSSAGRAAENYCHLTSRHPHASCTRFVARISTITKFYFILIVKSLTLGVASGNFGGCIIMCKMRELEMLGGGGRAPPEGGVNRMRTVAGCTLSGEFEESRELRRLTKHRRVMLNRG
jgi:hypothetical protein